MEIINIEQGHPTVQQAMVKLQNGIYRVRATGQPVAKIGPFSSAGREMSAKHPAVSRDRDWGLQNDGITVIMFK